MRDREMEYDNREAQDPASLSFPVGLVLLLTFLFCMCCFFCCCLHWEKLRSFLGCPDHLHHHHPPIPQPQSPAPDKVSPIHSVRPFLHFFIILNTIIQFVFLYIRLTNLSFFVYYSLNNQKIWKENRPQSVSVLMPGDEVPRFIAMACPALVEIVVQKPSQSISDNP